jgi:hypothetical protein
MVIGEPQKPNAMVRAPVLALPNATDPFIPDTDASDKSVGAELIQIQEGEERAVAYGSLTILELSYRSSSNHLASCPCGSLKFISQVRLLWSVLTVKCLPNK